MIGGGYYNGWNWINSAHYRDYLRAFVNAAFNFHSSKIMKLERYQGIYKQQMGRQLPKLK